MSTLEIIGHNEPRATGHVRVGGLTNALCPLVAGYGNAGELGFDLLAGQLNRLPALHLIDFHDRFLVHDSGKLGSFLSAFGHYPGPAGGFVEGQSWNVFAVLFLQCTVGSGKVEKDVIALETS